MKKIITLFTLIGHITAVSAQLVIKNADNTTMNSFSKSDEIKHALTSSNSRQVAGFDNRYEGVQGSPFLFADWREGVLTLNDSAVVRDKMTYKFEVVNNTIWLKMTTGEERILYNRELLSLELQGSDGKKHLIKKINLPNTPDKNHFSIIVFENEQVLLVKDIKKVFRKANLEDKGIVTVGKAYDSFEEEIRYYFKKGKNPFEEISLKKSKLMSFAPKSREKLIEQFCKDKNISGKITDTEAAELLNYIYSL